MKRCATVVLAVLLLTSCAYLMDEMIYTATIKRYVDSPTGRYMILESNCTTVQHVWEAVAAKALRHLQVDAFTDTKTMTIWYCTESGLKGELHNIQSYHYLIEAHRQDMRDAFPLIEPIGRR